jgi:hypothetical protein
MAKTCGAKTRGGQPCKRPPMQGKTRCKLHGGASTGAPKGNKNGLKHGLYAQYLDDEQRANFDAARVGDLDDEIRLMRVRLARAVKIEAEGKFPKKDWDKVIDATVARIENLEQSRRKLLGDNGGGGDNGPGLHDPDPDV